MVKRPHIVILGAGISGLSLGWFLKERFGSSVDLTILEKECRAGGSIQTHQSEGFLFEQGPRSCRTAGTGIKTLQLIEDLGLQKEVIFPPATAKRRFLYVDQKIQPIPHRLVSFLFSPLSKGLLSALWHEWRTPKATTSDESIYDFISRRFNPQIAERFIDPLTSGIYAGDIRQLSIKSCFPLLYQYEQQHGSILKGMFARKKKDNVILSPFIQAAKKHPLFSFRNGMETLTSELAKRLSQHLILGCAVKALHLSPHEIHVDTHTGQSFQADHLFAALPADALAQILQQNDRSVGEKLKKIPQASVAVVNLGWHRKILKQEGFGYLVPTQEREGILGVVWDSCIFPQQNAQECETRLTVMIGGMHRQDLEFGSESDFLNIAKSALLKHLAIDASPDAFAIKNAQQAIPQYLVGHLENICTINEQISKLSKRFSLIGNAFHGVSVNDCIAQAFTPSKGISVGVVADAAPGAAVAGKAKTIP